VTVIVVEKSRFDVSMTKIGVFVVEQAVSPPLVLKQRPFERLDKKHY
jgi:hypothetical protein